MSYAALVKDIKKAESKLIKITSQSAFKKIEDEIRSAKKNRVFLTKKYSKISELKKRGVKIPPNFKITIHPSRRSSKHDTEYSILGIPVTLSQIARGYRPEGTRPKVPVVVCTTICRPPRRPGGSEVCTTTCKVVYR